MKYKLISNLSGLFERPELIAHQTTQALWSDVQTAEGTLETRLNPIQNFTFLRISGLSLGHFQSHFQKFQGNHSNR